MSMNKKNKQGNTSQKKPAERPETALYGLSLDEAIRKIAKPTPKPPRKK